MSLHMIFKNNNKGIKSNDMKLVRYAALRCRLNAWRGKFHLNKIISQQF